MHHTLALYVRDTYMQFGWGRSVIGSFFVSLCELVGWLALRSAPGVAVGCPPTHNFEHLAATTRFFSSFWFLFRASYQASALVTGARRTSNTTQTSPTPPQRSNDGNRTSC